MPRTPRKGPRRSPVSGGREKPTPESIQTGLRLSTALLQRIDAYAARLSAELPGLKVNRSDAARILLTRALDAVEAEDPRRGE